jgi:hypothetical protein
LWVDSGLITNHFIRYNVQLGFLTVRVNGSNSAALRLVTDFKHSRIRCFLCLCGNHKIRAHASGNFCLNNILRDYGCNNKLC